MDHYTGVITSHFEIAEELRRTVNIDSYDLSYAYTRDVLVEYPSQVVATPERDYILSLTSLLEPVLAAHRVKTRMSRVAIKANAVSPSEGLITNAKLLAMEAYHFKVRIKLFSDAAAAITYRELDKMRLSSTIGHLVRRYQRDNKRVLKYRNFIVHGLHKGCDEFSDLRGWELGAQLLHSDIWLDYQNAFDDFRREWRNISVDLVDSMDIAIGGIQALDETMIASRAYSFVAA